MKLRIFKLFVLSFAVIFSVLNGRFVFANLQYWLAGDIPKPLPEKQVGKLPISPNRDTPVLPSEAILKIDRLGIAAPVVFGVEDDLKKIYSSLERGVVHYARTPKPGVDGTSIILGHSSAYPWYRGSYGSVFALLGKLQPGDTIRIQYKDGGTFSFTVKQSLVFSPFTDDERLLQLEQSQTPTIVLVSCWPVGTNYKRIAVQAELI